jgi:tRNA (guanine37-N1)-methyltransferase
LIKANPVIDAVESVMTPGSRIVFLSPSKEIFSQMHAHGYSHAEHLILVCGRYEGIDARFEQIMHDRYGDLFSKLSLGQFVTLGGEMPALVMVEAIVRLVPGVIKEKMSREDESYSPASALKNLEYPQYTRPEEIL